MKRLVCLSGYWGFLPLFKSCFVEVAPHADDLLMYWWGKKWSPILFLCYLWNVPSTAYLWCHCLSKKYVLTQITNIFLLYFPPEILYLSFQFSSVGQSCPTLCNPMNLSTPGLPVHHQLPQFTQTHAHRVGDAIQPSHPWSSPSPAPNPSQHQGLFQRVNSSYEVAKVLEFQLQDQSFQGTPRTDLL